MKKINRIYILGTSGSGKSTLAKNISMTLKIKVFDLDDIFWLKKYTKKRKYELREKKLKELLKNHKKWIMEGVYTDWSKSAIKKADLIIWMNPPKRTLTYRILKRHIDERKQRDETFKDCIELIKYARNYKKNTGNTGFESHKELVKTSKSETFIINNKKDIKKLLEEIK